MGVNSLCNIALSYFINLFECQGNVLLYVFYIVVYISITKFSQNMTEIYHQLAVSQAFLV